MKTGRLLDPINKRSNVVADAMGGIQYPPVFVTLTKEDTMTYKFTTFVDALEFGLYKL